MVEIVGYGCFEEDVACSEVRHPWQNADVFSPAKDFKAAAVDL